MKRIFLALFVLAGCAAQRSPEEERAANELSAQRARAMASIQITRTEPPTTCQYLRAASINTLGSSGGLMPATYDDAVWELKTQAVNANANYAVIDSASQAPNPRYFILSARLYRCS